MVVDGKARVDSVEDFIQQNAIARENNVVNFVDPGDTTDTASIASTSLTQSSVQGLVITLRGPRRPRHQRYPRPSDVQASRKGMGLRKWRRYQNTVGLLSEIEEGVEDSFAHDIAEGNASVFSELFENPLKMQVWEKFMKLSESEQRSFLVAVAEDFERTSSYGKDQEFDECGMPLTAEGCFRRIDRHLRHLVARRSPPVEIIEPMERELVEFFGERPEDVLEVIKPDTYHRMIFHAICQYFGLCSKSEKKREACQTRVRNRSANGVFLQPPQRLSVFLAKRYDL